MSRLTLSDLRLNIIQLLINSLEFPVPNLSHLMLSFNLSRCTSKTNLQSFFCRDRNSLIGRPLKETEFETREKGINPLLTIVSFLFGISIYIPLVRHIIHIYQALSLAKLHLYLHGNATSWCMLLLLSVCSLDVSLQLYAVRKQGHISSCPSIFAKRISWFLWPSHQQLKGRAKCQSQHRGSFMGLVSSLRRVKLSDANATNRMACLVPEDFVTRDLYYIREEAIVYPLASTLLTG